MGFTDAIKSGFNNYVGFSGRACRSEYWFWVLFVVVLTIVTSIIDGILFSSSQYGPITSLLSLALLLPGIAVSIRRLHDMDRSGWWLLLALIPLVGSIILLIWFCMRGTVGANRFGADPLGGMPAMA